MSDMGGLGAGHMHEAGAKMQSHVDEFEARHSGSPRSGDEFHEPNNAARRALVGALVTAFITAVVVYFSVAPRDCFTRDSPGGGERFCKGAVAFEYNSTANGQVQAVATALFLAVLVSVFTWTILAPPGRGRSILRGVLTVALLLAVPISLLSFTYLFFFGPPLALLLLLLLWRPRLKGRR